MRCLAREAAAEDRHPRELSALLGAESLPGRVEHDAHAAVPVFAAKLVALEEVQIGANLTEDLLRPQHLHPRRREHDGERDAAHHPADGRNVRQVVAGGLERRVRAPRALEEELHCAESRELLRRRVAVGDVHAVETEDGLGGEAQRLARGGEDGEVRSRVEHGRREGDAVEKVFEVVEDEEQAAVAEPCQQLAIAREARLEVEPDRVGHRGDDLPGVA